MNLILDLIVVVLIAAFLFNGARKGFIKSIGGLASVLVSFFCASRLSKPLAAFFSDKVIGGPVRDAFVTEVAKSMNVGAASADAAYQTLNLPELLKDAPDFIVRLVEKYGTSIESVTDGLGDAAAGALEAVNRQIVDGIVMPTVHAFSNALAFLAVFLVTMAVCGIAIFLVDMVFKLPILHAMNTSLGLVVGAISGFLCIGFLCVVYHYVAPYLVTVNPGWVGEEIIENTLIFRWFYHNNIVMALLQWFQSAF